MNIKFPTLKFLNGVYAVKGLMFFGPQYETENESSGSTTSIMVDNETLAWLDFQLLKGQKPSKRVVL
jgi:hypothetical protein